MEHKKANIDTLYYGFPVFLISTVDKKGITNIAPMSSSWVLGENIVIGIGTDSKTFENLQMVPEVVINLPNESLYNNIERIAPYTGKKEIKNEKLNMGYSYLEDKFLEGNFTAEKSDNVKPYKIKECPIQIEAKVSNTEIREWYAIVELKILSVYCLENMLNDSLYISEDKWKPLIYNFRKYHGISDSIGKNFRFKDK